MRSVKMHDDEADIDVALVRRLVADQFPDWADLPVEQVASSGTENAMFRLGADMVVRLPRIPGAVDNIAHELHWLPRLAPHLPCAVPAPLGEGGPSSDFPWPWAVYRWIEGVNPHADVLDDPVGLAADLAAFVTTLRMIDPTDGPLSGRGVALSDRDDPTREAIAQLHGTIDTDAATAIWDDALSLPDPRNPIAWMHADLSPGNVLTVNGRLSAVLDFAAAGIGDPTVDLIVAWNLLPASAREVFREGVGADEATWIRGRAWALSIALIQLPYYRHTNPGLAANSRHVIKEVLADRS
jgi:aminoglycoside phosphotransferase (APT) family kinase protein